MPSRPVPPRTRGHFPAQDRNFRVAGFPAPSASNEHSVGQQGENEYWNRLLTESLPNIVWAASPEGANEFCNVQWTAYTGFSQEATLGDGWTEALHPDERQWVTEWWRRCRTGAGNQEIRYRLRRADGSYRWHLIQAKPIHDQAGKVIKWIGTAVDIQDQVEAEARLQASDAKYRNLVELSQDAIYIRVKGKIVFANAATARIYGASTVAELIGEPLFVHIHPDYIDAIRQRWQQLQTERKPLPPYELKLLRKDGTIVDVESIASPIEYQGQFAAHVVVRDISERKALQQRQIELVREQAAHAQAAAAAEHFRLLAEAVPNMVWTARPDGLVDYANRRVLEYLDCPFTVVEGRGWESFAHPEDLDRCLARWTQSLKTGSDHEIEFRIRRGADREYRWHMVRALPVRDGGGEIVRWVGTGIDVDDQKHAQAVLNDSRAHLEIAVKLRTHELLQANAALRTEVTERKQAEEALRSSEDKLRKLSAHLQSARETERSAVAREIHDELGASLTAVKMDLARYVKTFSEIPPESQALLLGVTALVDSAIQSVRRIATQLRPSILDHLGLWPALEWQLEEFETRYSVRCSITLDAMPSGLEKDAQTALFRIVQEALTNVARHARATRVRVTVSEQGGRVAIRISDNGIGVPFGKISDPTSCGIQGMHERAEAFGGCIEFDTVAGAGTRITVSFPLHHAAIETASGETI